VILEETIQKLMKMHAMVTMIREMSASPATEPLSIEETLGMLIDREWTARENKRLDRLLKDAGGALAHAACRQGFRALCIRTPRLLQQLAVARADGTYTQALTRLAKVSVLVLDDFLLAAMSDVERGRLARSPRGQVRPIVDRDHVATADQNLAPGDRRGHDGRCDLRPSRAQRPRGDPTGRLDAEEEGDRLRRTTDHARRYAPTASRRTEPPRWLGTTVRTRRNAHQLRDLGQLVELPMMTAC
jgi:hypothetical protein